MTHLITGLDIGGAETMLVRLLAATDRSHVDSSVISLTSGGALGAELSKLGIPLFTVGMKSGSLHAAAVARLIARLREIRPDVLQTWLYHADLVGLVAGTLARVPRIAWNIRCSHLEPSDLPRFGQTLLRVLAVLSRFPAIVVCNSRAGQLAHARIGYRPRAWSVIPNGVDTNIFRPDATAACAFREEIGVPRDVRLVGMLARLHPMKDYPTFFKAAAHIAAARQDVHFVAVGRGVSGDAALNDLVGELGLQSRITLIEERRDPQHVLAALDIAVLSSRYGEGFPNVIAEAMACSTPCVVTDVGDSATIVGDTGIVVPPMDSAGMTAGILRLVEMSPVERKAIKIAARSRIITEYGISRSVARYEQLYLDLAR